jgi:hypothetical protein
MDTPLTLTCQRRKAWRRVSWPAVMIGFYGPQPGRSGMTKSTLLCRSGWRRSMAGGQAVWRGIEVSANSVLRSCFRILKLAGFGG